jgi:SAM-dependent methyltransferase
MSSLFNCHICGSLATLKVFSKYSNFKRVTSDCKPWPSGGLLGICSVCTSVQKPIFDDWVVEANQIYSDYSIYYQGGGEEPKVYNEGFDLLVDRSNQMLERIFGQLNLKASGKLLDIGCGNGAILRSFSKFLPDWSLEGTEMDDRYKAEVESIIGVKKMHIGGVLPEHELYDVITMVHVLEHISNPQMILEKISGLLKPDGILLIVVPDLATNPFDIIVADHCSHFYNFSLNNLLHKSGYANIYSTNTMMDRQLIAIAKIDGNSTSTNSLFAPNPENIINWLDSFRQMACALAADNIGIFGSSINAVWLASEMDLKFDFFVDEDTSRVGRKLLGKSIASPLSVEFGSILIPIPHPWCNIISKRLAMYKPENVFYVTPQLNSLPD